MIIFRYLAKEIFSAFCLVIGILSFVFLSNDFVRALSKVASGKLPFGYVMHLMLLTSPHIIGLLLPIAFFLAVLLALGRLYSDSEMTVMSACGLSPRKLVSMVFLIALVLAVISAYFTFSLGPQVSLERQRLLLRGGTELLIESLLPGNFQQLSGGQVVYVEKIPTRGKQLDNIFSAIPVKNSATTQWNVVWATHADIQHFQQSNFLEAHDGTRYAGNPGDKKFSVTHFKDYGMSLTRDEADLSDVSKGMLTKTLWPRRHQAKYAAELHWRLAFPIMTLILALIAIPLSRLNPRQNKFSNLPAAVLILLLYSNVVFIARDWIASGKIGPVVGLWWLHALAAIFAVGMFAWPQLQRRFHARRLAA